MKKRIADHLIRVARRLDPNCCVDFRSLPTHGTAILRLVDAEKRLADARRHLAAYQ